MRKVVQSFLYTFSILLGLIFFSFFIYFRFIRERLPKNIPFNFSVLGFFIILYICCIYIYIIYQLIKPPKTPNELVEKFLNLLYTPLMDFDAFFKNISYIKPYYEKWIIKLAFSLQAILEKNILFDIIFYLFPRIILLSVFITDIFYFGKLLYIYKVLLVGLILLIRRYIIYSIKKAKKDFITSLKNNVRHITTRYIPGVIFYERPENLSSDEDDDDDDDDDDEWPPTMALELEAFIDFWTKFTIYKDFIKFYPHIRNEEYAEVLEDVSEHYRNLIVLNGHKPYSIFPSDTFQDLHSHLPGYFGEPYLLLEQQLKDILQLALILEYKVINDNLKVLKYSKVCIFTVYLVCWSYILLVSVHTLNINELINLIINIKIPGNPFI